MLVELVERVQCLSREVLLNTERGKYIYDDSSKCYKRLIPEVTRSISSVESLAAAVVEEARRRENATGDFMTAILSEKGGVFYPDDKIHIDQWNYSRVLSQQWTFLTSVIHQSISHLEFIRTLQGLRPSIVDYQLIAREFKQVTLDKNASVTSQPIVEGGPAGTHVSITLDPKSGQSQLYLPGEIKFKMPFTKGFNKEYEFVLNVDAELTEDCGVRFRLVFPERDLIVEQALKDEIEFFKDKTQSLPQLLVLLDYNK